MLAEKTIKEDRFVLIITLLDITYFSHTICIPGVNYKFIFLEFI